LYLHQRKRLCFFIILFIMSPDNEKFDDLDLEGGSSSMAVDAEASLPSAEFVKTSLASESSKKSCCGKRFWLWTSLTLLVLVFVVALPVGLVLSRGKRLAFGSQKRMKYIKKRLDVKGNLEKYQTDAITYLSYHPGVNDLSDDRLSQTYGAICFFYSTNGEQWDNLAKLWSEYDRDVCDWVGITCDDKKNIIHLELANRGLSGDVPEEITRMRYLETINLNNNQDLNGEFPLHLSRLNNLKVLTATGCDFSGEVDRLCNNLDLDLFKTNCAVSGDCITCCKDFQNNEDLNPTGTNFCEKN